MGGQIRGGWIWRFWGAPIFSPEVPKHLFLKGFGTSGIGAPQKRQIQPRRIWPPICGILIKVKNSPKRFSGNHQSLVFSERGQLSQAIPQFHVERMLNEWTPIARFESQHNERRVCEDYSREIWPPTNASDLNCSDNSR